MNAAQYAETLCILPEYKQTKALTGEVRAAFFPEVFLHRGCMLVGKLCSEAVEHVLYCRDVDHDQSDDALCCKICEVVPE